jgi:riboflavin-specific deaminase-like protein
MELNEQIEDWIKTRIQRFTNSDRPFVTLAYAQSLDGSITTRRGEPMNLSGASSMQITHQLRSLHDGILVGIGTVLSDDPQLTVRECQGKNPQPIILDSNLRTPASARVCQHPDHDAWLVTAKHDVAKFAAQPGVQTIQVAADDHDTVSLGAALAELKRKGIGSLMVEGGATVITSFLQSRLADAVVLTIAPKLVGGYKAVNALLGDGRQSPPLVSPVHSARAGDDLLVWGDFNYGESR